VAAPPPAAPAPANRIVAEPPAPAPAVQASRPAAAVAPIVATPVVQRVDGAAPAAEPGGRGGVAHSETELDELAKALFGRIRGHLRTEVIHDREAKGLTFDAF
ncbi:MAG: hypothetical protein AB1627_03295, partial [Chloroflexota bacterium]